MAKKGIIYREYPRPLVKRIGAKVSWYTYATLADAEKCSEAARINARIQEEFGYDFGYQTPGNITKTSRGYEVCIP